MSRLVPRLLSADTDPTECWSRDSALVWALPDDAELPDWSSDTALSAEEVEREERVKHPLVRHHFRRGRSLARSALGLIVGEKANSLRIENSVDGKPYLCDFPQLHFNISHTKGFVVVAVAPVVIGVDVEVEQDRDHASLVQRYFATEEQRQFVELPHPLKSHAFVRGWTCKEALLKGTGTGVRDLQNCAVDLDPRSAPQVLRSPDERRWHLTTWRIAEQIHAALAVQEYDE